MESTSSAEKTAPEEAPGDIVFDTSSGFSEEEQRSILAGIEAVTSHAAPRDVLGVRARKRGIGFPLAVNLAGLLLLAGGVLGLSYLFRMDESVIRQGPGGLGLTERKLIQEIRQENEARINEKEREITDMMAKLSGLDLDLQDLEASVDERISRREGELRQQLEGELEEERNRLIAQNLSEAAIAEQMRLFDEQRIARMNGELASYREELEAERKTAEAKLQQLQEEYRNSLAGLQTERAQILEASRSREASLRAQLEERAGELTARYAQNQEELRRLSDEQDQAVLFDRQMAGFYTAVRNALESGTPDKAAATLTQMGEFLETPSLRGNRAVQARKEPYQAAMGALRAGIEAMGVPVRSLGEPGPEEEIAALREQIAALEEAAADQTRQIAAFQTQDSARAGAIGQYEQTITSLRAESANRQREVNTLQAQTASQEQTINTLRTQSATQEQTINTLRTQSATQEQTINTLRTQSATQEQTITTLRTQGATQEQTINTLRTQSASQGQTITTLRAANAALTEAVANLEKAYNTEGELRQAQNTP
jgi:chromosome segregation ATPase